MECDGRAGGARVAGQPVPAASELVGDLGVVGVVDNHQVAVENLGAADQPGIVGGPPATPAASLPLDLHVLVSQLQKALGALEETALERGE